MAIAIDEGGPTASDLHPKNKQIIGRRLARLALGQVYGRKIETTGPLYQKMTVEGSTIRLHFSHAGGGLTTTSNQPIKGFAVCGKDGKWVGADARIDNETVVVSHKQIHRPMHVRYGWADNPDVNLFNRAGFPAAPFRTDGP